jgi:putative endonuclease
MFEEETTKLDTRKKLGVYGEKLALAHLIALDYHLIQCNWRCRTGELDIIVHDDETLVFVEVRTRRVTGRFGTPQESVDLRKQRQVRDTAQVFLHHHRKHDSKIRFDLISVELSVAGELLRIDHIKHAF